jgi:hypothetical protein
MMPTSSDEPGTDDGTGVGAIDFLPLRQNSKKVKHGRRVENPPART